jgi:hypothetical protein
VSGGLTVVLDETARASIDYAIETWGDAERAWAAVEWVLARDFQCGRPLTESGNLRAFVYVGARSIDQPDIMVIYEIASQEIIIRSAEFADAQGTLAGRA